MVSFPRKEISWVFECSAVLDCILDIFNVLRPWVLFESISVLAGSWSAWVQATSSDQPTSVGRGFNIRVIFKPCAIC